MLMVIFIEPNTLFLLEKTEFQSENGECDDL